jgi:hypothetical protein
VSELDVKHQGRDEVRINFKRQTSNFKQYEEAIFKTNNAGSRATAV